MERSWEKVENKWSEKMKKESVVRKLDEKLQ